MQIVPRGKRVFVVYDSKKEFLSDVQEGESNVLVENWKEGKKGDWVLADDGMVMEVLHRGEMKDGKRVFGYIRTACGTFRIDDKTELDGYPRKNPYSFSSKKYPDQLIRKRQKISGRETVFASLVSSGKQPGEAYITAFPTNNRQYADHAAELLLQTKRVQNVIKQEIINTMDGLGVTPEYIVEKIKEIVEQTLEDKDRLGALKLFVKMAGMDESEKRISQLNIYKGLSDEQFERIVGGKPEEIEIAGAGQIPPELGEGDNSV